MAKSYVHGAKVKRRSRAIKFILLILLILLVLGSYFSYQKYQTLKTPTTVISNSPAAKKLGYINNYFLFKDTPGWQLNKQLSSNDQVVYDRYKNGSLAQRFSVYIDNSTPVSSLKFNHILPVNVLNQEALQAGSITDACAESLTAGDTASFALGSSSFKCDSGSNSYSLLIYQLGGGVNLKMMPRSHEPISFSLVLYDYTPQPDTDRLIEIVNSFKAV